MFQSDIRNADKAISAQPSRSARSSNSEVNVSRNSSNADANKSATTSTNQSKGILIPEQVSPIGPNETLSKNLKTNVQPNIAKPINKQPQKRDRQELLNALRDKLKNIKEKSGAEKSTKHGKGVQAVEGPSNATVKGTFNQLSMSKIEMHIQEFSLRFVDLIICCMVLDNYIYGFLILMASLAEIVVGWIHLYNCPIEPLLPYLLILNGVLNVIQVHIRNLANQRRMDYFLMTIFRLLALFSLIALVIILCTIEPALTIWYLPETKTYSSYGDLPILHCSRWLYDFTYYFCMVFCILISLLSIYALLCIGYMAFSGQMVAPRSKTGSKPSGASSAKASIKDSSAMASRQKDTSAATANNNNNPMAATAFASHKKVAHSVAATSSQQKVVLADVSTKAKLKAKK